MVESDNEGEKCLGWFSMGGGDETGGGAHQRRRAGALDVGSDAVEDGDATAYGEQQHSQQSADSPQAPWSAGDMESGLCPDLLARVSGLDVVESECDIGGS